jgi:hypothetical protein
VHAYRNIRTTHPNSSSGLTSLDRVTVPLTANSLRGEEERRRGGGEKGGEKRGEEKGEKGGKGVEIKQDNVFHVIFVTKQPGFVFYSVFYSFIIHELSVLLQLQQ